MMLGFFLLPYHQHNPRCRRPSSLFLKFVIILLMKDSCPCRILMVEVLKYQGPSSSQLVTIGFTDGNYTDSSIVPPCRWGGVLTTGIDLGWSLVHTYSHTGGRCSMLWQNREIFLMTALHSSPSPLAPFYGIFSSPG